jgi:hypothetical protein
MGRVFSGIKFGYHWLMTFVDSWKMSLKGFIRGNKILSFVSTIFSKIGYWMGVVKNATLLLLKPFKWMITGVLKFGKILFNVISWAGKKLKPITKIFTKMGGGLVKIGGLTGILGGVLKILGKFAYPLTIIMAIWDAVWGMVDTWKSLGDEVSLFDKLVYTVLGGLKGAIKGLIRPIFDLIDMIFGTKSAKVFDRFMDFLEVWSRKILDSVSAPFKAGWGIIEALFDWKKGGLKGLWDAIDTGMKDIGTALLDAIK